MFEYLSSDGIIFSNVNSRNSTFRSKNLCWYFIQHEQIFMEFISYLKKMNIFLKLSFAVQEHCIFFH